MLVRVCVVLFVLHVLVFCVVSLLVWCVVFCCDVYTACFVFCFRFSVVSDCVVVLCSVLFCSALFCR